MPTSDAILIDKIHATWAPVTIWTFKMFGALALAIVSRHCSCNCTSVLTDISIGGFGALHDRFTMVSRVSGLALALAISLRS